MNFSNIAVAVPKAATKPEIPPFQVRLIPRLHSIAWVCLLLACIGATWFSYQCTLVPHSASYTPDWQGAKWIQAADTKTVGTDLSSPQADLSSPVAYFRYAVDLNTEVDGAFVTIAASQVFRLYVNGDLIATNSQDFTQGNFPQAYMYDIDSLLRPGINVLGLRIANVDQQIPAVRVSFGIVEGQSIFYHNSGDNGWQATGQSSLAHPRFANGSSPWADTTFDASSWLPPQQATDVSINPTLTVNPLLYEQPLANQWVSAGEGHEGYFVRQVTMPFGFTGAWLRLAATGTADVYINGQLFMVWNGQAPIVHQVISDFLSTDDTTIQYRAGLALGIYDIGTYLHPGVNAIAIHVQSPGVSSAQIGLDSLNAAMVADILLDDQSNHASWLDATTGWHASYRAVSGWEQASNAALAWPLSVGIGRPGASRSFYLTDSSVTPRDIQLVPSELTGEVILASCVGMVSLWLLLSFWLRRYTSSYREAFEMVALAYLPPLAVEAILVVLTREPQLPQPFPYTWYWAAVLISLLLVSYFLLMLNAYARKNRSLGKRRDRGGVERVGGPLWVSAVLFHFLSDGVRSQPSGRPQGASLQELWLPQLKGWLRKHWAFLTILLLAIPMICYNLPYEPYWQDELTSYYAAKGILAHGLPILPSGFLYPKGELYSYVLALSIAIFGDQNGSLRFVTIAEYLISLPVLYKVGTYFFNRRIALLAMAMLAFSPISMIWGRQVRMYEQAQLLTILVIYLFYRAMQERQRVHLIYLAVGCLVLDYLSHEEIFIILPALLLCVLFMSRDRERRAFAVVCQKHWWIAAAMGASIIGLQLAIVIFSHPPVLGTDQSQRPLIQFTADNIPFYFYYLFLPGLSSISATPWLALNSALTVVGCVWAVRRKDRKAKFCALFLAISFVTLVLVFTLATERYIYPLLPVYYLMGAYAVVLILRIFWSFTRPRIGVTSPPVAVGWVTIPTVKRPLALPMRIMVSLTLGMICACILILPVLPVSGYNLFISQVTGLSYHRHYPDYDDVAIYMQHHWQKGDIVIAVSPAISVLYYVGHVNYFFSVNRALYLFERDGHIIDTPTGSTPLLNQQDFQAVLASYARIWIISDNGLYQSEIVRYNYFTLPPDFHIVFEGYGGAIYFRGS